LLTYDSSLLGDYVTIRAVFVNLGLGTTIPRNDFP
jgi:hypothetical protein